MLLKGICIMTLVSMDHRFAPRAKVSSLNNSMEEVKIHPQVSTNRNIIKYLMEVTTPE